MNSDSPVHDLVSQWWAARLRPSSLLVPAMRLELIEATLAEIHLKTSLGRRYDPFADGRVLWAAQYLQNAENSHYRIHPDIKAQAAWIFNSPAAPCGKDRAAGAA